MTGQPPGDGLHLLAVFDHARAGHHDHLLAANDHVSDLDLCAFGVERARGQFVRRADAHDLVDPFEQLKIARVRDARSDRAEQRVARPRRTVNVETQFDQAIHNPDDLFLGRVLFHYDDHITLGSREWGVGGPKTHSPLPILHSLPFTPFDFTSFNALDPPRFVNHALEKAANGFGVEWATVRGGDVGDDLRFAFRRINLEPETFFDMTDLDGALRPFVEELDQFEIDLVNPDTPIVNCLFAAILFAHNVRYGTARVSKRGPIQPRLLTRAVLFSNELQFQTGLHSQPEQLLAHRALFFPLARVPVLAADVVATVKQLS